MKFFDDSFIYIYIYCNLYTYNVNMYTVHYIIETSSDTIL